MQETKSYREYAEDNFKLIPIEDIVFKSRDHIRGGGGDVYQGKLRTGGDSVKLVALKELYLPIKDESEMDHDHDGIADERFVKEMRNAAKVKHVNISKIEGYYTFVNTLDGYSYRVIVSEWATGGNMTKYLKQHGLTADLRKIATGIAQGLEHIHENDIIHADLKGSNILMTEDGTPMLSDFGQARALNYTYANFITTNFKNMKGTVNWVAPEIAGYIKAEAETEESETDIICTKESDMWSYGMVIYELITRRAPYDNTVGALHELRILNKIVGNVLPDGRTKLDERKKWLWDNICILCWKYKPSERISAGQAIEKLMQDI